jgi:hydroxyethylthiazole kinase-like uncharacterized protein yjeF
VAAAGLAEAIETILDERADGRPNPARILLLVGSGNNGGDTLFAGAHLAVSGDEVTIVPVGSRLHEEGLATALAAGARAVDLQPGSAAGTRKKGVPSADSATAGELAAGLAADADVIVDGILGIGAGADPSLRGMAREVVAAIRPLTMRPDGPRVVAVDVPSGIDPDGGRVPDGNVLAADLTVTFGGCKAGLLLAPASEYAGRIEVVDVGLGAELARMEPAISVRS